VIFELDPSTFYLSDQALDYAVVAVKSRSTGGQLLDAFGMLTLIVATPKALIGDPVNIIQYPEGGAKQYATVQNRLIDILDQGFLHYETDTLEGSSGSPAFSARWEIVALHHVAVPEIRDGKVVAVDGSVWDESMGDECVHWVANEGVRISAIVKSLSQQQLPDVAEQTILNKLLATTTDPVSEVARAIASDPSLGAELATPPQTRSGPAGGAAMANNQFTVTGPVTIHVCAPAVASSENGTAGGVISTTAAAHAIAELPAAPEKKLRFDLDYSNRKGYDELFLDAGDKSIRVPTPGIAPQRMGQIFVDEHGEPKVIKYNHFELVMNMACRFQMWSAVNVDYDPAKRSALDRGAFGADTWIADKRVPIEFQVVDEDFYKPAARVDRGHVVRRTDNAWGSTASEIELSNSDAFHWTNCTPQHEAFNRTSPPMRNGPINGLWGEFEDYIQENLHGMELRACILAGPVLDDETDPVATFQGKPIQYPLKFWKVIAVTVLDAHNKPTLKVFGFILSQKPVVDRFGIEAFRPGQFAPHQVTLKAIEGEIGVRFAQVLHAADQLLGETAPVPIKVGGDIIGVG
jgi:endonuclease G